MDFESNVETNKNRISDSKTTNKLREKDQHIPSNISGIDSSATAEMCP